MATYIKAKDKKSIIQQYIQDQHNLQQIVTNKYEADIKQGYGIAQRYYNGIKKAFLRKLRTIKLDGRTKHLEKNFVNQINNKFRQNNQVQDSLARGALQKKYWDLRKSIESYLNTDNGNNGIKKFLDDIIQQEFKDFVNNSNNKQNNTITSTAKSNNNNNTNLATEMEKERTKLIEKINRMLQSPQYNAMQHQDLQMSLKNALPGQYDATDINNKIIMPMLRNYILKSLNQVVKGIDFPTTYGLFHEAAVYSGLEEIAKGAYDTSKFTLIHTGSKGGIADIEWDFSKSYENISNQSNNKNILTYGMQIKAYDLKNINKFFDKDYQIKASDYSLTEFKRISNQAQLLNDFRLSKKIKKESGITDQGYYQQLQAEAMWFLSQKKRLHQIMGENNVAFVEKSGFRWITDILKMMLDNSTYACFKSQFRSDFEAQIGIL